jgi:uncharacterized protein
MSDTIQPSAAKAGIIHKYKLGGLNIILDVNSGAVHSSDELTYDLLDSVMPPFPSEIDPKVLQKLLRFYSEDEIRECYAEIKQLYADDILYSSDIYEKFAEACVAAPIKAMCLLIAEDCNLSCGYCFAEGGEYGKGRTALMPLKTAKAALDFLMKQSSDREFLEVDFFGGEPLMNFETVKETVKYGRKLEKKYKKKIRFTITTNGLALDDEKIDFINAEMSNVVLSLDGREEVHDRMRKTKNGGGSYALVLENIKKLVERRGHKDYYIRGTFTRYNTDFANDVFALAAEGFDQISVEPVIAESGCDYAITEKQLPEVFCEYEKLAKILINRERAGEPHINFFHFMLDIENGPCAIKRLRGCGCGNEYVAVNSEGDIYPCHQFTSAETQKMGNVFEKKFNTEKKDEFAKSHIYSKPDCAECWAKFYCSGGCAANNFTLSQSISKPVKIYCELQKKRLECALAIKAAKAE